MGVGPTTTLDETRKRHEGMLGYQRDHGFTFFNSCAQSAEFRAEHAIRPGPSRDKQSADEEPERRITVREHEDDDQHHERRRHSGNELREGVHDDLPRCFLLECHEQRMKMHVSLRDLHGHRDGEQPRKLGGGSRLRFTPGSDLSMTPSPRPPTRPLPS